jgi:hypothetical protein
MNEEESEIINAEVIEEKQVEKSEVYDDTPPVVELPKEKMGKLSLRHKLLASYAARCYPVSFIAKQLGLREQTVYRILEEDKDVWVEIDRIIVSMFREGDIMLANLRMNALKKLDEHLESESADIRDKAIDKILKCYDFSGGEGAKTLIANFYGQGGKSELGVHTIDEVIIQRRKDRLLENKKKEENNGTRNQ